MIYTVLGIFDSISRTQQLLLNAQSAGFSLERMSCILHYPETISKKQSVDQTLEPLVKLYKITVPTIGTILIGGPFISSFGLTGATRATMNDAATGLVAGGIAGALIGMGIGQQQAMELEKSLQTGKVLLALPATDEQIPFIKQMFLEQCCTQSIVMKTPTHQYPYLLSSLLFQYEEPANESIPAYVGIKGGKRSKSQATKKRNKRT